jgi:hypothetical protein
MFTGVLFGDYPEEKKEATNGGRGTTVEQSQGRSGSVASGRKSNTGGNKQPTIPPK